MRVGFLHSLIRKEEKLLIHEFRQVAGVELVMLDDRKMIFDLQSKPDVDVVLERCINHSRALHGLKLLESAGIRCVNTANVANTCGPAVAELPLVGNDPLVLEHRLEIEVDDRARIRHGAIRVNRDCTKLRGRRDAVCTDSNRCARCRIAVTVIDEVTTKIELST